MPAIGTVRTQMDDSDWIFNCLCINPFIARSLVRESYNIEVTDTTRHDFFVLYFVVDFLASLLLSVFLYIHGWPPRFSLCLPQTHAVVES